MIRRIVLLAIACVLVIGLSLSGCGPAGERVVTFPDPNLEAAVREALDKASGPIHASELAGLASLAAQYRGIQDLSGLQYCTSLTDLSFGGNGISDISPLANLTNLENLSLQSNRISDISPLVENAGLSRGHVVHLEDNPLSSDSISIYIPQLRARGVTVDY